MPTKIISTPLIWVFAIVLLQSARMPEDTTISIHETTETRNANDPVFTARNFESKILNYQPPRRDGVSDYDFERGIFILDEVRKDVIKDSFKFCYADYWNITSAFRRLDEPTAHIELAFQKAIDDNAESICGYLAAFGDKAVKGLTKAIPNVFLPFYETACKNNNKASAKSNEATPEELQQYASENGYDYKLIKLMAQISADDQRYRKATAQMDWTKQTPLDEKNLKLVDMLFQKHNRYIGRSLVGRKYESTMWAVIQHSNIEVMEKYLPVVHNAVKNEELHGTPLKMLLDRIYCAKKGYQFFGSQFGGNKPCELAGEKERKMIEEKYGF